MKGEANVRYAEANKDEIIKSYKKLKSVSDVVRKMGIDKYHIRKILKRELGETDYRSVMNERDDPPHNKYKTYRSCIICGKRLPKEELNKQTATHYECWKKEVIEERLKRYGNANINSENFMVEEFEVEEVA